jgi:hypothetical protein
MQYKKSKEGFRKLKNRAIIFLGVVVLFAGIVININNDSADIYILLGTMAWVLVILTFTSYRTFKKLKEVYGSYTLTLEPDELIITQFGKPETTLMYGRIQSITKKSNGSLVLKSAFEGDVFIPYDLEDFDYIEKRLAGIRPVDVDNKVPFLEKYKIPVTIIVLVAFVLTMSQTNIIVVIVCALIVVPFMVYSFFTLYKNKDLDPKVRRGMWWLWVVIFSIVGRVVMSILNNVQL